MKVADAYNRVAEKYDGAFLSNKDLAENRAVFSLLNEGGICASDKILDIGCGTGLYLEHNACSTINYLGIDISSQMISIAQKKFPGHVFVSLPIEAFNFKKVDIQFDLVISLFGSLSYVTDLYNVLYGVPMSDRGRIFFMFFNPCYMNRKSYILRDMDVDGCPQCYKIIGCWKGLSQVMYMGDPFCIRQKILPYVEPEFFRKGAGTWGGKPTW